MTAWITFGSGIVLGVIVALLKSPFGIFAVTQMGLFNHFLVIDHVISIIGFVVVCFTAEGIWRWLKRVFTSRLSRSADPISEPSKAQSRFLLCFWAAYFPVLFAT